MAAPVLTAGDLVNDALKLINALSPGELPSGYEAQDGQMRLNDLLANWATQQLEVFFVQNLTFTLPSAAPLVVTAGTGGNITTRPIKIESANVIRGGIVTPVEIINALRWAKIRDKASATAFVPEFLYNDNQFPLANLNLWPGSKDTNATLDLWIWGEFTTLNTSLYTDLVVGAAANLVTSASNPFTSADINSYLNVPQGQGTNFTPGRYQITGVAGGVATLSANIGTIGATGGIASYDQALALPPGYWKAIRFNLALDFMPEYGRVDAPTAQLIRQTAGEAKAEIRGYHQANQSASEAPPVPDQPAPQTPAPAA